MGVAAYGVSCTTLEDVFLKINEDKMSEMEAVPTGPSEADVSIADAEQPALPRPPLAAAAPNGGARRNSKVRFSDDLEANGVVGRWRRRGRGRRASRRRAPSPRSSTAWRRSDG